MIGEKAIEEKTIEGVLIKTPKVSIIIPVYNVKRYLLRCVRSVLNQSYKDYEIILIDDGSTDGSEQLCDMLKKKDKRIKVIHKENGGLSSARNIGIENATGEYLTFVDSDDYISVRYLEILVELIGERKDSISIAGIKMGYDNNYSFQIKSSSNRIVSGKDFTKLFFDNIIGDSVAGKLFPRKFFDNIRFAVGRVCEDTALTYKLFYKASEIIVTDEALYYYYQRLGSIMHSKFTMKSFSGIYSYYERVKFIKNNLDKGTYDRFMQQYVALGFVYYYKLLKHYPEEKRKATSLKKSLKIGYRECYKSKQWTLASRIGGFIGCYCPYITGWIVKKILKV